MIDYTISKELRADTLQRDGFTCQMCGADAGDPNPYSPGRRLRLYIDHIIPVSQGGPTTLDNLRAICTICKEGKSRLQPLHEDANTILEQINGQPHSVQREIYEKLKQSIESTATTK